MVIMLQNQIALPFSQCQTLLEAVAYQQRFINYSCIKLCFQSSSVYVTLKCLSASLFSWQIYY